MYMNNFGYIYDNLAYIDVNAVNVQVYYIHVMFICQLGFSMYTRVIIT